MVATSSQSLATIQFRSILTRTMTQIISTLIIQIEYMYMQLYIHALYLASHVCTNNYNINYELNSYLSISSVWLCGATSAKAESPTDPKLVLVSLCIQLAHSRPQILKVFIKLHISYDSSVRVLL